MRVPAITPQLHSIHWRTGVTVRRMPPPRLPICLSRAMPRDRIFPVHAGVPSTAPRLRVGQSVWLGATDAEVHCSWTSAVVSEAVSALWPVVPVRAIPMPAGGQAVAQMLQAAELHVADCDVRPDPTVPPVDDRRAGNHAFRCIRTRATCRSLEPTGRMLTATGLQVGPAMKHHCPSGLRLPE